MEISTHRPRNVGWARAAALLYGDWGTSKAYVIGAAFLATGYASLPIILAVCALTGLVAFNYVIVCRHFPDGGGVYSSARQQSRVLAVLGSLLLVADLTVTASLSGWSAMAYFHAPREHIALATMILIVVVGAINFFGPKHSGSMAVTLAIPTVIVVVLIILFSAPHLTLTHLGHSQQNFRHNWTSFVGVILALSGVEAIANLTGVMKLDPGASMELPVVRRTASKAILLVAVEVVIGTAILGWAMLSLPPSLKPELVNRWDDMLTVLAEQYGTMAMGPVAGRLFGFLTALIVGLLLLSAVNTAIVALIGLLYLLARDNEMPRDFARLNPYGVPWVPVIVATTLPLVVVASAPNDSTGQTHLMELYAIGVVGAITVNLGSCVFNKKLGLSWKERSLMVVTALVLFAVELTLAKTKPNALFFIICILLTGFALRAFAQRGAQPVTPAEGTALTPPATRPLVTPLPQTQIQAVMVAARGWTQVLHFALEEARLRGAILYVLYVRVVAVSMPSPAAQPEPVKWQSDPPATEIMNGMMDLAKNAGVRMLPVYAVSDDAAASILDLSATLGIDMLVLGAPQRSALAALLRGDVVTQVARHLPDTIQLLIHG
ncbi:MAG TPA: universal stress protein [Candidatus Dormibacteraeota bacterium]|nr:universal stress protein [Candidatus Dormibacteraeota bacterium]